MKNLLLAIPLLLVPALSFAGNSVNNGVDQLDRNGDAVWFVGKDRVIQACYEMAEGFGVGEADAERTIRRAFGTWEAYFAEKKLDREMLAEGLSLATKVNLRRGCAGGEDLSFYFGVANESLGAAAKDFRKPLAFAQRLAYDDTQRWARGLVWVAHPSQFAAEKLDWAAKDRLLGVLLHELGHVYGCGHVSETIMRAELSEAILSPGDDFLRTLSRIDSGKQLYQCELCGGAYEAKFVRADAIAPLLGRALKGRIKAELSLAPDSLALPNGTLKIQDELGSFELRLRARSVLASSFSDNLLFHVPVPSNGPDKASFATRHRGTVYLATLEFAGRSLTVAYKRNTDPAVNLVFADYADQLVLLDPAAANNVLLVIEPKK